MKLFFVAPIPAAGVFFTNFRASSKAFFLSSRSGLDKDLIAVPTVGLDLIKALEQRARFESKDEFEKILSGLALIADYSDSDSSYPYASKVDYYKAYDRIGRQNENPQSHVSKTFGSVHKFRQFVSGFLLDGLKVNSFRYELLLRSMSNNGIISSEQSVIMLSGLFEAMLKNEGQKLTEDLLQVYQILFANAETGSPEQAKISHLFRAFIELKDVEGFIHLALVQDQHNEYTYLDNQAIQIYGGSLEAFASFLSQRPNQSETQREFLEFINRLKESERSHLIHQFKHIRVRKRREPLLQEEED